MEKKNYVLLQIVRILLNNPGKRRTARYVVGAMKCSTIRPPAVSEAAWPCLQTPWHYPPAGATCPPSYLIFPLALWPGHAPRLPPRASRPTHRQLDPPLPRSPYHHHHHQPLAPQTTLAVGAVLGHGRRLWLGARARSSKRKTLPVNAHEHRRWIGAWESGRGKGRTRKRPRGSSSARPVKVASARPWGGACS